MSEAPIEDVRIAVPSRAEYPSRAKYRQGRSRLRPAWSPIRAKATGGAPDLGDDRTLSL